jgi:hypothetical protein
VPALPAVPDVIRLELDFTVGLDAAAPVRFFWSYSGGIPTAGDMGSIAGQLYSAASSALPPVMHPDTIVTEARAQDLSSDTGFSGSSSGSVPGTESGEPLGADVCVLFNFPIGRHYRGGKPRGYWPLGTTADLLTRQTWQSASLALFHAAWTASAGTLAAFTAGAITLGLPVNVSYYGPPNRFITGSTGRIRTVSTGRAVPIVDEITGLSVNSHLGSQRRRNLIRT